MKNGAHLIQSTVFHLENGGNINFSINQKTAVQEFRFFHVRILALSSCAVSRNGTFGISDYYEQV